MNRCNFAKFVPPQVVRNPKEKVAPAATLAIDAIELHREPPILLKFHKPFDVISSMYEKNRTVSTNGQGTVSGWFGFDCLNLGLGRLELSWIWFWDPKNNSNSLVLFQKSTKPSHNFTKVFGFARAFTNSLAIRAPLEDLKDALPGQRAPWDEEAVREAKQRLRHWKKKVGRFVSFCFP